MTYADVRRMAEDMVAMQNRLADLGLFATMRQVNEASRKLGWEAAEKLAKRD